MFYAGGFLDKESKDCNTTFGTTKKDSTDTDKKKWKSFVPVTLKMLHDSNITQGDSFDIDGEAVNDVIVCGRILSREELPTRTIFDINDSTGSMRVTFYNREENVLPHWLLNLEYDLGIYVKIFGNARVFKEAKAIVGASISKITDFDELCNHFLQVFIGHSIRVDGVLPSDDIIEARIKWKTVEEVNQILKSSIDKIRLIKLQVSKEELFWFNQVWCKLCWLRKEFKLYDWRYANIPRENRNLYFMGTNYNKYNST